MRCCRKLATEQAGIIKGPVPFLCLAGLIFTEISNLNLQLL